MKVLCVLCLMLCITGFSFADRFMLVHAGANYMTRNYTEDTDTFSSAYTSLGVNAVSFLGQDFGFFASSSIMLPLSGTDSAGTTTTEIDLSLYDTMKISFDMLFGIGYMLPLNEKISVLLGGGLHFSGFGFLASDYMIDSSLSYVIGPGIGASCIYQLNPSLKLALSLAGGYDLLEIIHIPDLAEGVEYSGSFAVNINLGFGFSY